VLGVFENCRIVIAGVWGYVLISALNVAKGMTITCMWGGILIGEIYMMSQV